MYTRLNCHRQRASILVSVFRTHNEEDDKNYSVPQGLCQNVQTSNT